MVNEFTEYVPFEKTNTYNELLKHYKDLSENINLRDWFEKDPDRPEKYTFDIADLHIDLSKNLIDDKTLKLFSDLADEINLKSEIEKQFSGKHINNTEDRAVLHTALRRPQTDTLIVDGQDVIKDVHEVLQRMYAFSDKVLDGEWKGVTGKNIDTIVNIGIGGSDLGPKMAYEALKPFKKENIEAYYVSNVDPNDLAETLNKINPETTLFIIVSKTFTTLETMTNANVAKSFMLKALSGKGSDKDIVKKHFVAVSTALDLVAEFGIDTNNAFGFWNFIGGRYSVDSAVGLSLILAFGKENFAEFLSGFNKVDTYFADTEYSKNVVVLMGMLNVWYCNFFESQSHAILAYSQYLSKFAQYLQQLTMESNGKAVRRDGTKSPLGTGEIFWGEPGTNGQHAFYQLIHQGTKLIPCDFIGFVNTYNPLKTDKNNMQDLLLANFLAQTSALAFGKTPDELRKEGISEDLIPFKTFTGNRPTTTIMAKNLTPSVLGQLIALYEQITFVQGIVWGINSFDQWGVELGKKLALGILPSLSSPDSDDGKTSFGVQDNSTKALIKYCLDNKE